MTWQHVAIVMAPLLSLVVALHIDPARVNGSGGAGEGGKARESATGNVEKLPAWAKDWQARLNEHRSWQ